MKICQMKKLQHIFMLLSNINQFFVLQTPAKNEGKPFHLLIDSKSTHSVISPRCIWTLNLPKVKAKTLIVELTTGKVTRSTTLVVELSSTLNDQPIGASFRFLPLGIYDGILGMDWLLKNDATLRCKDQRLTFTNSLGEIVSIMGNMGAQNCSYYRFLS